MSFSADHDRSCHRRYDHARVQAKMSHSQNRRMAVRERARKGRGQRRRSSANGGPPLARVYASRAAQWDAVEREPAEGGAGERMPAHGTWVERVNSQPSKVLLTLQYVEIKKIGLFDASDSFSIFNSPTHHKPYLSPCPPRRPPRRDRPTRVSPYPPPCDVFVFKARRLSARPLHSLACVNRSGDSFSLVEDLPSPAPARVFVPRRTPPLASPSHARCIRNP